MLNALIVFLMPTIFFGIMTVSSLASNNILRVGGVFVGFAGMMLSIIFLIVNIILCVG
jgi:hypothetical protein